MKKKLGRKLFFLRGLALLVVIMNSMTGWCGIYVITDGYKILPDGKILEFGDKPPELFKQENLIWNSKEKEINIAGAGNEVIAFQIVIDSPASEISLESEALKGKTTFPKNAISFSLEGFVSFRHKFYPDILVPLNSGILSSFSIPYKISGVPEVDNQSVGIVMVEVAIPENVPPGEYLGRIFLKGGLNETLNLKLTVWNFALPETPTFVLEFNSYGSPVNAITIDQRNPYLATPASTIAAEHEFYRCANQHRAYLNIIPVHSQRGTPRYAPALAGRGKDVKCDWAYWDQRFGPVLDGSIFEDGNPPPYFYLPFNLHWPWGFSHDENLEDHRVDWRKKTKFARDHTLLITQEYLDEWDAVARQTIAHFAGNGWTRSTFQVYLNHANKPHANSPWRLDEPYNRWDFQVLSYFAKLTNRLFQNDLGVKIRYRLDLGHFYCRTPTTRCYKAKRYDLPLILDGGGAQLLEPVVDLWYINASHIWGNRLKISEVGNRDREKEMFIYGGGQDVTHGATEHRSLFWYLYHYRMRGYCSWNQGCLNPQLPLKKPGNDHVWYSGKELGFNGPLPSLRMKGWRRSSYDAEYLTLAEAVTSREHVVSILNKLCEYERNNPKYRFIEFPSPNNNPYNFEIARLKLASMIMGAHVIGPKKFQERLSGPAAKFVDQLNNY